MKYFILSLAAVNNDGGGGRGGDGGGGAGGGQNGQAEEGADRPDDGMGIRFLQS